MNMAGHANLVTQTLHLLHFALLTIKTSFCLADFSLLLIMTHGCLAITTATPSKPRASSMTVCAAARLAGSTVLTKPTPMAFATASIDTSGAVSYTHLRAHETRHDLV